LNNTAGWVHDVAFSPSGNVLAFVSHDSNLTVVYPSGPDQPPRAIVSISTQLLPFKGLVWSTESEIVAAGYVSTLLTHLRVVLNMIRIVKHIN
jgi:actin related protein 2/3 complex, subunit 1A/1B